MSASGSESLRLSYHVEIDGEESVFHLPYVIGVIADLSGAPSGDRPPWGDRRFRDVDRDSLAALKAELGSGGSEESWRGLELLVRELETDQDLKIRAIDASRDELATMLAKFSGDAWDESPLFSETYERTYGIYGGEPYALLIADYRLGVSDEDALISGELSKIAAASYAPLLRPAEGQPADGIYSLAAEIGRSVRDEGWCGGLAKPEWADAAGLQFEELRRLACCGPFVQHLKCIVRDRISPFTTADMGRWLNLWLGQYVAPAPAEMSASRPLLEGRVELTDSPKIPGVIRTKIRLRPGHGLAEPGPALEVETYLPGGLPG